MAQATRIKLKPLEIENIKKDIPAVALRHGAIVGTDFDKITASWSGEKPTFKPVQSRTGNDLVTTTEATGTEKAVNKMFWLDEGTPPHRIVGKTGPLVFQSGYSRKTTPRVIGSQGGGSFGDVVYAGGVDHPGTEEGAFAETINNQRGPKFQDDIEKVATNL